MLNDKEVSNIIKRVFAHAKFGKSKTKTVPAKPEDGFDTKIAQEGRNKGYELGQQDFKNTSITTIIKSKQNLKKHFRLH